MLDPSSRFVSRLTRDTVALVLAGGRGSRLHELTDWRAKPAVHFGGKFRIIDFPLSNCVNSGIRRVGILTQYKAHSLIRHVMHGWSHFKSELGEYVEILPASQRFSPNWYQGTADALFQNIDIIAEQNPKYVLVLSGDHIYKMDYQEMIDYHYEKDADLTIAFTKVSKEDAHRFGIASLNSEDGTRGGRVLEYVEKPENPQSDWASMTILCFKPDVLYQALEKNQDSDSYQFGQDIIPMLLKQNRKVYGYKFDGYWGYTRTVDEYWQSSMDLLGADPLIDLEKWVFRTNMEHRRIRDNEPVLLGDSAVVKNCLLYNGCKIGGTVENSILFPGVHVKKGAVVKNSVLFFDNIIGKNCYLNKVVSDVNNSYGPGASVGVEEGAELSDVTVLGWNNYVPAKINVGAGVTVYPNIRTGTWPKHLLAGEELK